MNKLQISIIKKICNSLIYHEDLFTGLSIMTRLRVKTILSLIFIILHNAPRLGLVLARTMNYNNPKYFKIGGVLSNVDSKQHFEKTIDVRLIMIFYNNNV